MVREMSDAFPAGLTWVLFTMDCCSNPKFRLVKELGHAESVDFDLVRCESCGAFAMRSWSEHRPDSIFYEAMASEEGSELRASEGRERKALLKRWFDDH